MRHTAPLGLIERKLAHCGAGQKQLMLASASQDKYLRVWRIQPEAATSASAGSASQDTTDLAAAIARQATAVKCNT